MPVTQFSIDKVLVHLVAYCDSWQRVAPVRNSRGFAYVSAGVATFAQQ